MANTVLEAKRVCASCSSAYTYVDRKGRHHWYNKDGRWYCERCDNVLFKNSKRYRFSVKRFIGLLNHRTGYCSQCPNNIYDGSCRRTHMHHFIYIIIVPWFGREELCVKCHNGKRWLTN